MRIAYVTLHSPRMRQQGVGKKIIRTINAWRDEGHQVALFMHTYSFEHNSGKIPGEIYAFRKGFKLFEELGRCGAAREMVSGIRRYGPDIIYLRYGIYVYPVHQLVHIAPVVEELNTNDVIEQYRKGLIYGLYNSLTRGIVMRRVSGMVGISDEMATSLVFSKYGKPIAVIANGIDLQNFRPLPAPSNDIPKLIFIGTPIKGQGFHGVDKLIRLASLCRDVQFDVIGYDAPKNIELSPNIVFHGYLDAKKYQPLLATSDVAIASLALHRVGLHEGSPLKSREYLAYGIPTILPYMDTDLDDLVCDFLYKIPNRENNVETHAKSIRDFAYQMRGKRVDRTLLGPRIDTAEKEKQRLAFLEQFLS